MYLKLHNWFNEHSSIAKTVLYVHNIITVYVYLLFVYVNIHLAFQKRFYDLLLTVLLCGAGFVGVTLLRKIFKRPRPYEIYGYTPILSRNGKGDSFPSRHTYSVTVIAFASFQISPYLFVVNAMIALVLGAMRVLGGVHRVSDVVCAYVIALLIGIIFLF